MATVPVLNARQLRAVADAAASLRIPEGGQDAHYLVFTGDEEKPLTWLQTDSAPQNAVFGLDTLEVEPRPTPTALVIECEGATRELAKQYDAVFWSESAVEKFVLPYYASKSLWEAAAVLDKISRAWYGRIPPEPDDPAHAHDVADAGEEAFTAPFALAHVPDSEWTPLDAATSAGHDLHLLIKDGDLVRAVRLSDLPDPPQPDARSGRAGPARRTRAATGGA